MKTYAIFAPLALIAAPLGAQDPAPMTYDERITCGALLFLSSQQADDPSIEQQFGAHHLTKAIAMSGKAQDAVIAETEQRMSELESAWLAEDAALGETFSTCILTVMNEFEG